jgi:hypothetical protein
MLFRNSCDTSKELLYERWSFNWHPLLARRVLGSSENIFGVDEDLLHLSRSGLVVKFVLAMHEPRVRFTAATIFCQINVLVLLLGQN